RLAAWRARRACALDVFVKKFLTAKALDRDSVRSSGVGPVESCPDRAGGVVAVDAPVGSDGTDDGETVMPRRVAPRRRPWTALVLDFDLGVIAWVDPGSDDKGAAWQARTAVQGGIGSEFGGTQDHLVGHGQSRSNGRRSARTALMCLVLPG